MSLLDHYWTLASEVPEERIEAARLLIKGLVEKDAQEDWDYALNRLIRGLSSSRGGARLGFSMALAEILEVRKDKVSIDDYYTKIGENFQLSASIRGAEERGILFGQLFSLQTLAKSSLWKTATIPQWTEFVDMAVGISLQKPWLREPVFFTLCETLASAPEEILKHALDLVAEREIAMSCEGIAIALVLPPQKRATLNDKSGWHHGDPLCAKNITELARVMKTVPVNTQKSNNWKPDLHFVWGRILEELITPPAPEPEQPPTKKQKKSKKHEKQSEKQNKNSALPKHVELAAFWRTVVDEGLLAINSSPERKLWGYAVFNQWIKVVENPQILFTPNFVRTLSNQLAQSDRSLHKMAKLTVETIQQVAKEGNAADIISAILSENPSFDHTSKSKTVSDLITCAAGKHVGAIVKMLLNQFKTDSIFSKRQWAINSIIQLLKSHKKENIDWVGPVLDALVPFAYYDLSGEEEKLTELAQQRIATILSITMNLTGEQKQTWPFYVYRSLQNYDGPAKLRVEFEDDIHHSLQRAKQALEKIHKKRMSSRHVDSPQLQAFELLFSMVLLQVYASSTEAVTILEELLMCYNNISAKGRQQDTTAEEEDVDASQVLTEVLISFLSQKSALLRKLSEDVWGSFAERISAESLQLLFDILAVKESLEGQSQLFNIEDDEYNGEDDEEEGDAEKVNGDEDMELESEEESDSEGESGSESESEGLDEKDQEKLALALGVGENDSSDSEESMDDEQMSALDDQLATIFRERKKQANSAKEQKQENTLARENVVALKSRVLDLLEIYVTKQPTNILCLNIITPLLDLMQTTKDVNVGNKAREALKKLCKTANLKLGNSNVEDAFGVLGMAHKIAAASSNKPLSLACNQASVYITKTLLNHDKQLIERISQLYMGSLNKWFLAPKNKTTASMFVDLVTFLSQKR